MATRQIALGWVEETILSPDRIETDPQHPERTRSYRAIALRKKRVLRVVHRADNDDIVVIIAHFDRRAGR